MFVVSERLSAWSAATVLFWILKNWGPGFDLIDCCVSICLMDKTFSMTILETQSTLFHQPFKTDNIEMFPEFLAQWFGNMMDTYSVVHVAEHCSRVYISPLRPHIFLKTHSYLHFHTHAHIAWRDLIMYQLTNSVSWFLFLPCVVTSTTPALPPRVKGFRKYSASLIFLHPRTHCDSFFYYSSLSTARHV